MRILFCGGGTLGPVTPLLAVAEEIRAERTDAELAWIGTRSGPERPFIERTGIPFHAISAGKLRRQLSLRNLIEPFLVIKGFFEARRIIEAFRPDAVVSAGGFVAVPAVWAAALRRIRVHVHQQDIRPGLANRLSSPFASSISAAFEKSLADFPGKNVVWTGNPVRAALLRGSREEAKRIFGLEDGVPTVLAFGGGTGAASLNALMRAAVPLLAPRAQIIHSAGKGKAVSVDAPRYHQRELLTDELPHALAAADVVVTRAGMGALTELAALGKPAIVVPIPGSHQEENAAFFADHGAAIVVDERAATPESFAATIAALVDDDRRRAALAAAMRALVKPDAAARVARLVLAVR